MWQADSEFEEIKREKGLFLSWNEWKAWVGCIRCLQFGERRKSRNQRRYGSRKKADCN